MRQRIRNAIKIIDKILMIFSPLMLIGFLVALIILVAEYGEHRTFVRKLEDVGYELEGVVDLASPKNAWVSFGYTSETGEERHGVADMFYYNTTTLYTELTPGTHVTLRVLPWNMPGSDRVILADQFAAVKEYQGYLSIDMLVMLAICWVVVALEPQVLYLGLLTLKDLDMEVTPS